MQSMCPINQLFGAQDKGSVIENPGSSSGWLSGTADFDGALFKACRQFLIENRSKSHVRFTHYQFLF
jgi:hypothetical protein